MLPTTTTGSPLLTLCDTLPPSSPQHSTSTKKVEASIHSCLVLSKRRPVSATRNLVTLPFCVRLSSGDVTTLPTTVMALTVLLGCAAPGGATGSVPVCRRPSWPDEPRGGRRADLWTNPGAVDRAPAGVHSQLRARTQPALSKGAFPGIVINTEMTPAPLPQRRRTAWTVVGAVSSLGIGAAAVLGVQAVATPTTVMGQASPAQSDSAPADFIPGSRPGTSGGSFGGTSTTGSTTASAAQQVGIVEINTVLKYQSAQAAGTGMVLTSDGEILTNNHVVDGATSISVTISSTGATYTATVVGTDPTDDVAVLQLSHASGLRTAKLSTHDATVGESVTGVGNAGGTGTLTAATGSLTALGQSITATDETGSDPEQLSGLIETDAAIQAGDSGGPLYGDDGTIIGMDTAASSGGASLGYAIPIATAEHIAAQIESGVDDTTVHQGTPAFLGVSLQNGADGATVAGVLSGGAAESAGLAAGDVITSLDGTAITSTDDLSSVMASYAPGDRVTVTWTTAAGATESAGVTL